MSRGSSSGSEGLKLFFMNISGLKAGDKVHIKQVEALGDKKYNKELPTITNVKGLVHKIETRVQKSEKFGDKEQIVIWLKDIKEGEMYCLSCGLNSLGRSIINTLASVEGNLGELSLSVYMSKKGRPSVFIEHNGKKVGWKVPLDEQKKYVKEIRTREKVDGEVVEKIAYDYLDLDALFLNMWNTEVKAKVQSLSTNDHPAPKKGVPSEEPETIGDELPWDKE
jgi:hypothetical protein